jgi:hypothetical protein
MIWLIFFHFFTIDAQAEYRAFELVIENVETKTSRSVLSNLDPQQYVGYYPLLKNETVRMNATWRCRGNTSNFKPICPQPAIRPKGETPNVQVSAWTDPNNAQK